MTHFLLALHWFDFEKLFPEVDRILKKNGTLAIFSYGLCYFDNKESNEILNHFYSVSLGGYWSKIIKIRVRIVHPKDINF